MNKEEILSRFVDGEKKFQAILDQLNPPTLFGPNPSFESEEGLLDQLRHSKNNPAVMFYMVREDSEQDPIKAVTLKLCKERFERL